MFVSTKTPELFKVYFNNKKYIYMHNCNLYMMYVCLCVCVSFSKLVVFIVLF